MTGDGILWVLTATKTTAVTGRWDIMGTHWSKDNSSDGRWDIMGTHWSKEYSTNGETMYI